MKLTDQELQKIAEEVAKKIDEDAIDVTYGLDGVSSSYSQTGAIPIIIQALTQVRDAQQKEVSDAQIECGSYVKAWEEVVKKNNELEKNINIGRIALSDILNFIQSCDKTTEEVVLTKERVEAWREALSRMGDV